tara:strand:- start:325 stop:1011 length:687 start_codon:yes stop_codon:yes gene_type:complete
MDYKVIIPARLNSKRLPNKNVKLLIDKPLIQYTIEYALNNFQPNQIWINSDDHRILNLAKNLGVKSYNRPKELASDFTPTIEVLKDHLLFFINEGIKADALVLLQPTSPFRSNDLIKKSIKIFENSKTQSLATFTFLKKKIGTIKSKKFKPVNYSFGQRTQDLREKYYYENGQLYITKSESILDGKILTDDIIPLITEDIESTIDIDDIYDFYQAEKYLINKSKNEKK